MAEIQVVSYSELDTYRQCPLKHLMSYEQRWTKPLKPGDRRSTGTLFHTVLEAHYRVIQDHQKKYPKRVIPDHKVAEVRKKAVKAANAVLAGSEPDGSRTETEELVAWMYKGYVEKYGIDDQWLILGVEVALQTPLLGPSGRPSRYHLKARLDLVIRDLETGGLYVVDNKSGQNLPNQMDLEIDDQFGLYQWLLRQLGKPADGSIHNAARTTRNQGDWDEPPAGKRPQSLEQRMSRTYLARADVELTAIATDAHNAAYNARPPASRRLPLYSSPDPRNCGWKCDFKEVHLAMRSGTPMQEALEDFGFIQDFTRH